MNYKQTFSVVLMAVVDANYRFLYVNVGAQKRISDAGVFNECEFAKAMDRNDLHFPQPTTLPGSDIVMPYVLVADEAFPLRLNIMKPFPRRNISERDRVFNYRLSRARRVVENASGYYLPNSGFSKLLCLSRHLLSDRLSWRQQLCTISYVVITTTTVTNCWKLQMPKTLPPALLLEGRGAL